MYKRQQIGFLLGDSEKIDGDWDGTVADSYTNITVEQQDVYKRQDWNSSAEIAMPNKFKSVYSLAKYVSVNPF